MQRGTGTEVPRALHSPTMTWTLLCDDPALAVEASRAAARIGLDLHPHVTSTPFRDRFEEALVAIASLREPSPTELSGLPARRNLALLRADDATRGLASDLGHPTTRDVEALIAVLALREAAERPWMAGGKHLEAPDRHRLAHLLTGPRSEDQLEPGNDGLLVYAGRAGARVVGPTAAVAEALDALKRSDADERPPMPRVEGVDPQSVLDVILGPARTLSDPASKSALATYDLPLPLEELCASPSRAASEAARIGFPVRVALASPDLRIPDHPDLVAERIENAARVRDVFRQIMTVAQSRKADARILGVTVSATARASASLDVRARCLTDELVWMELGFADAHGRAARDVIQTVLPCRPVQLERALMRLAGHDLLLPSAKPERKAALNAIGDALHRVAAFLHDWQDEVARIEIRPLAILVSGDVELREVSVHVTDAFQRSLESMTG